METNKAVFLDRDGTIIQDKGYMHKPEDLEFITGATDAIKKLNKHNYLVLVVTQQSGIGRGYYTEEQYHTFNEQFLKKTEHAGAKIDKTYYCPHHPTKGVGRYLQNCECKKPKTGMIQQATQDYQIALAKSWVIGDKTCDIKMGENAGCRTITVKTGRAGADGEHQTNPTYIAKDLPEAVEIILKDDNIQ